MLTYEHREIAVTKHDYPPLDRWRAYAVPEPERKLCGLPKIAPAPWFCLRCLTGDEDLAAAEVEALGLTVWVPTYRTLTKPKKRKRAVEVSRALLPGYLLARVPHDQWRAVRSARHIIGWVAGQSGPQPILREKPIRELRERVEAGEFNNRGLGPNIKPGTMLEVLFGPFMGWRVSFIGMVGKRIEGEISLMGSPRRVKINPQHINMKG